jgi:hypothetical protein
MNNHTAVGMMYTVPGYDLVPPLQILAESNAQLPCFFDLFFFFFLLVNRMQTNSTSAVAWPKPARQVGGARFGYVYIIVPALWLNLFSSHCCYFPCRRIHQEA